MDKLAHDIFDNNENQNHKSQITSKMETGSLEEHNFNYYHEYCRLFIANVVLSNQMKELVNEKNDLIQKLQKLEKKSEDLGDGLGDDDDKKKRFRRVASQIERHYKCPIESCSKSYGSEGSLHQHLKLKHPEYVIEFGDKLIDSRHSETQSTESLSNFNSEFDQNKD